MFQPLAKHSRFALVGVIFVGSMQSLFHNFRGLSEGGTTRHAMAEWLDPWAVVYEVFVRTFYDSNGDGIGDLKGLIAKLDYLNDGNPETKQDLGVDALWLMPVFESPSYHGYDTTNYRRINPDYGTNEDFQLLLEEAHRRGIRIIVDYVMNHTGSGNPWFVESSSPGSAKRDWYVWNTSDLGWHQPGVERIRHGIQKTEVITTVFSGPVCRI